MIVRNEDVDCGSVPGVDARIRHLRSVLLSPCLLAFDRAVASAEEAALSKLRPVEGRRGRDYGWQLGKLYDFIEPLPFRPETQEIPHQ